MVALNQVKEICPLNDSRWDTFVENHPYGTIYQHSVWMKVITRTYKHIEPVSFILEDNNGDIRAAIPCCIVRSRLTGTRIVSLPFTSYCDPLVDNNQDFRILLDEIISKLENISASFYEIRVFKNQDLIKHDKLQEHSYHKIQILNIKDGFENVKRLFHKGCIVRSVKKARKCGVSIRQGSSEEDVKRFYFLHAVTRKRQGFPIQPYRFFRNMWEIMYPKGNFTLLLAEFNKMTIAGMLLFKFKDTVCYEHGASIPKYLSVRPNHLVMWKAIELSCAEGYHSFDFGKTPQEHTSLLNYKKRWGGQMYDLPYFYYPEIKGMMALEQEDLKYKMLSSLVKYSPLPLTKAIGEFAYRHLG